MKTKQQNECFTHISNGNSKLGEHTPNVSMPQGITCRKDCDCIKGCYAGKGTFKYQNIKKSYLENLENYKKNPNRFFNEINAYLDNGSVIFKYFRWFVSGDIVDYNFFLKIIEVAKLNKYTRFLVFTKKYSLVNMYLALGKKLPNNLKIIFSHWDKTFEDKVDNPYNLPTSYVDFRKKEKNADFSRYAFKCSGYCPSCKFHCWHMKNGQQVVFKQH